MMHWFDNIILRYTNTARPLFKGRLAQRLRRAAIDRVVDRDMRVWWKKEDTEIDGET